MSRPEFLTCQRRSRRHPMPAQPQASRCCRRRGRARMVGLAYASVPLYRLFCQVTGFGGTTQRAEAAPASRSTATITVRFDANIAASLPWTFEPVQREMTSSSARRTSPIYRATNTSAATVTGTAVVQRDARHGRRLFQQDRVLLLHRADAEAGRERSTCRSSFFVDPAIAEDHGSTTVTHDHAVLHFLSGRRAGQRLVGRDKTRRSQLN